LIKWAANKSHNGTICSHDRYTASHDEKGPKAVLTRHLCCYIFRLICYAREVGYDCVTQHIVRAAGAPNTNLTTKNYLIDRMFPKKNVVEKVLEPEDQSEYQNFSKKELIIAHRHRV